MRSKRVAGERRIEEALAALANALDASGIPWMVIGGIAIIARGVRRMTTDIDAVVRGDRTNTKALLRLLAGKRIAEPAEVEVAEIGQPGGTVVNLLYQGS